MMRILIADDHAMFRQGLAAMLAGVPEVTVIAQTHDGYSTLEAIDREQPDVAVVDISMPGLTGMQILREIRRRELPTRVVLLTMHTEPELAAEAVQSGVSAYLLKENAFADLVSALHRVVNGETVLSPSLSEIHATSPACSPPEIKLSPREQEILQCLAYGCSNKQTAYKLDISIRTAETHRANIMAKLHLHSTAELVRYAIQKGIVHI